MFNVHSTSLSSKSDYTTLQPNPNNTNVFGNKPQKRITNYISETPNKKRHFHSGNEKTEPESLKFGLSSISRNQSSYEKNFLKSSSLMEDSNMRVVSEEILDSFEVQKTTQTTTHKDSVKKKKFVQFRPHFLATLNVHTVLEHVIPKYPQSNSFVLKGFDQSLFLIEICAKVIEVVEMPSFERMVWVVRVVDSSCKPSETLTVEHWREPEDFQSPLIVNETYRFIGKIAQLAHGEKILRCCWLCLVNDPNEVKYSNLLSNYFLSLTNREKEALTLE